MRTISYLLVITILLISCDNSNNKSSNERSSDYYEESIDYDDYQEEENYYEDNEGFENGTYSASVEYYNPETGYSTTYTLDVEVEENQVTLIYFPNDGYLDDDHIWPDELDEDGFVSIDGEEGKTYDVQIDY